MPMLHGEGHRAFQRLQEEIIRTIDDDSTLAWGLEPKMYHSLRQMPGLVNGQMIWRCDSDKLLASSPAYFANCADLVQTAGSTIPFTLTNMGLDIQPPLVPISQPYDPSKPYDAPRWIGLLSCSFGTSQEFLGILLCGTKSDNKSTTRMWRQQLIHTKYISHRTEKSTINKVVDDQNRQIRTFWDTQIAIHELGNFQEIGYSVQTATEWFMREG